LPVHIRATQGEVAPAERDYLRRKLNTKLGKFANAVERVSVRVQDVNGPRGGVDQICRIKVVLRGLPSVMFESRHASRSAAIDLALSGTQRAVRRATQRRRTTPRRKSARRV
jgi:ribosome-associated translation inhibitor RaiA